jgi:hypothetical protein
VILTPQVTPVGFLHGIYREETDRINAELIND